MNYKVPPYSILEKESIQQKIDNYIPLSPKIKICKQTKNDNRLSMQDSAIFYKYKNQRSNSHNKQQINEERVTQREVSAKNILNEKQKIIDDKINYKFVSNDKSNFKIYELKQDNFMTDRQIQPNNNQWKEDNKKVIEVNQPPRSQQEEFRQVQQNIKQLLLTDRNQCNCKQKQQELQNKNLEQQQQVIKLQNEAQESKKQQDLLQQQKNQLQRQIMQMKNENQQILNENNLLRINLNQQESIKQNQTQNIMNQQKIQIEYFILQIENQQKEIDLQNVQIMEQQQLCFLNEELQSNIYIQDQKLRELQLQIQKLNLEIQKLQSENKQIQQKFNQLEQQNQEHNHKINQQTFLINKLQCKQQNSEEINLELIQQIEQLNLQLQTQIQSIHPPINQEFYRFNKIKFRLIDCEIQKGNLQTLLEQNGLKNIQFKFVEKELIEYQIQNESLLIKGSEHSYQIIRNQNESYALKGQGFQKPFISKEAASLLLLPSLISNFILMDFYNQLQQVKQKYLSHQIPSFEFVVPIILKEENSEQYWIAERQYHGERKHYNSKEGRIYLTDNEIANNFMTAFSFYTNYTTMGNYTILDFVSTGKFLIEPSICTKNSGDPAAFLVNFQIMKIGYEYLDSIGIEYIK